MKSIPYDIEKLIDQVYRKKDNTPIKSVDWKIWNKYDIDLNNLLSGYQIKNLTNFSYDYSYHYHIILHDNPNAMQFDFQKLFIALKTIGTIEQITLEISAILPYFQMTSVLVSLHENKIVENVNNEDMTITQRTVKEKLNNYFGKLGFMQLDKEVSQIIIPDISTKNTEKGETSIKDCIF